MNIFTGTIDEQMAYEDIQETRKSQSPEPPYVQPEKRALLRNLSRIEEIHKRTRILETQIYENPLDFFNILVWKVQIEKLALGEEKLLKKNNKLHKLLGNEPPPLQQVRIGTQKKPYNPNIGYAPIDISSLSPRYQDDYELKETEMKLEELYNLKDSLYMAIQQTPTGIADQRTRDELDEITRNEASLVSKVEELRLSKEADISTNKLQNIKLNSGRGDDLTREEREKNLEEIKSVPEWNNQEEVEQALKDFDMDEREAYNEIQNLREQSLDERDRDLEDDRDIK